MRRLPYTWFQRIVTILAALLVIGMFINTIINYRSLPDRVPTHFGITGEPDAWGGKGFVWFMPAFSAAMFILMATVAHFPACWNVPASLNSRNMGFVYRQTKNMLCSLNLGIMLMCAYFHICTVRAVSLHRVALPVILAVFAGGTLAWIIYIWRRSKTI